MYYLPQVYAEFCNAMSVKYRDETSISPNSTNESGMGWGGGANEMNNADFVNATE